MRIGRIVLWVGLVLVLLAIVWIARVMWWAANAKPGSAVDYASRMNELVAKYQKDDTRSGDAYATMVEAGELYTKIWDEAEFDAQGGAQVPPADWPREYVWPLDLQLIAPWPKKMGGEAGAKTTPAAAGETSGDEARGGTASGDADGAPAMAEQLEAARSATQSVMEKLDKAGINELLDKVAASKPGVRVVPSNAKLLEILLPSLAPMRVLARYNSTRMRVAALAGDDDEMVRAFDCSLAMGVTLMHQGTLIERLVGLAIADHAKSSVGEILVFPPEGKRPDAAMLRRLMTALDRLDAMPPMELAMNAERLGVLDTIQWTHSDDGRGDGYLLPGQLTRIMATPGSTLPGGMLGAMIGRVAMPTKKETTKKANEFYDTMVDLTKLTRAQQRKHQPNADMMVTQLGPRDVVLKMLLPAFGQALSADDRFRLTSDGLRTQLALELFKLERGGYPETLAELVPNYLKVLPLDPYSADSRQVIRYRKPAPEGEQRPYLLYSVGVDALDQGGLEPQKESDRMLPLNNMNGGAGFDYVLAPAK
jgi:hypothetical protein